MTTSASKGAVNGDATTYVYTVAFRVDDDQSNLISALCATFPSNTKSDAMRWLLDDERVREIIGERVRG